MDKKKKKELLFGKYKWYKKLDFFNHSTIVNLPEFGEIRPRTNSIMETGVNDESDAENNQTNGDLADNFMIVWNNYTTRKNAPLTRPVSGNY